jgi:hypothetical protein
MPLAKRFEARYCPKAVLPVSFLLAAKPFTPYTFNVRLRLMDLWGPFQVLSSKLALTVGLWGQNTAHRIQNIKILGFGILLPSTF